MPEADWWGRLLLVAAALHVGLELVVHLVVYPALARASSADGAVAAHRDHMRRMSLAVAPVYGLLVVSSVGFLAVDRSVLGLVCLALVLATFAVTAFAAVPAHEALLVTDDARARAALHRRLARADLSRLVLAAALLAAAWLT